MPWLMKAEPDSRVVKGKDVKFSVDDFEKLGVSQWDGVRNHEAKKIMKEKMKLGDKVLFYHSNTKVPGVFAIAEVAREGYPDYTAWDESHPYFDAKTSKDSPTWFMVDVRFIERLTHPPTLALIKHLASLPTLPDEISFIGQGGFEAIKAMQLVNRGRLSVQPVEQAAYDAVVLLGTQGGWEELLPKTGGKKQAPRGKRKADVNGDSEAKAEVKPQVDHSEPLGKEEQRKTKKARVVKAEDLPVPDGVRRSKRTKR
ncbi:hypothetical protein CI109_105311 [Kwoniella shandongensis]|uniref:Uncharacterized protein n=1 Tax=Kwoniella shandongensis TaxID=1734106 RepID=A0A5M6BUR3_9TREE|nr:uncharacterized protein CI109_004994 [Kwoniella shandongensis]KAA5526604.1 hypothetical protein CI109_004994 [Kwoniella shandongensis]